LSQKTSLNLEQRQMNWLKKRSAHEVLLKRMPLGLLQKLKAHYRRSYRTR
jgi:hypothetical protein